MRDRAPTLGVSGWRLHGQRTGVGRYILSIIECLSPELVTRWFSRINVYVPQPVAGSNVSLPSGVNGVVIPSTLSMLPWENLRLGPTAKDDVVLYPSFSRPFVARGATVVTVHDATMRIVPEMFSRRARLIYDPLYGWSARAATLVLTTSEAAKRDIVHGWDVDPDKIRVTPMAASNTFRPLTNDDDRERIRHELLDTDAPYFIFVGKISGRRNVHELMRAFAMFKLEGHPHKLVVVGPSYAVEAVNALAAANGFGNDLITRSYVTDETLNRLYACADAFIMPAAYENGSLPVFEAQASGTPIISVRTDGTEEITGGAALLIPQLEPKGLAAAMTQIANDESLRNDLARRGLENSRRYSWERCASETLAVCREAAEMHQA